MPKGNNAIRMKKGCVLAAAVAFAIIVGVVIATVGAYKGMATTTPVPRITVIVTDETTNRPIADVVVNSRYIYYESDYILNCDDWPMVDHEIGETITDSSGIAAFAPLPVVENPLWKSFYALVITVNHPRYGERANCNLDYIDEHELPSLAQPVRFRLFDRTRLPAARANWLAQGNTVWPMLCGVNGLVEYTAAMHRLGREVDAGQYLTMYRNTLEQTCDTPYANIAARNFIADAAGLAAGPQPGHVKFYIEKAAVELGHPVNDAAPRYE